MTTNAPAAASTTKPSAPDMPTNDPPDTPTTGMETATNGIWGRMAAVWWNTHQPAVWNSISNPVEVLARIEEQINNDISDRQAQIQHNLPPIPDFWERATAIRQTLVQATELVLDDWFPTNGGPGRLPTP